MKTRLHDDALVLAIQEKYNWKQSAVAEAVGYSPTMLSCILTGKRTTPVGLRDRLQRLLETGAAEPAPPASPPT